MPWEEPSSATDDGSKLVLRGTEELLLGVATLTAMFVLLDDIVFGGGGGFTEGGVGLCEGFNPTLLDLLIEGRREFN